MKRGLEEIQSLTDGLDSQGKTSAIDQRFSHLEPNETHLKNEQQRTTHETQLISDRVSKAARALQERVEALETTTDSHKQRLVGLETIKTKQEMNTPD